jgi:hypothetical protein
MKASEEDKLPESEVLAHVFPIHCSDIRTLLTHITLPIDVVSHIHCLSAATLPLPE